MQIFLHTTYGQNYIKKRNWQTESINTELMVFHWTYKRDEILHIGLSRGGTYTVTDL